MKDTDENTQFVPDPMKPLAKPAGRNQGAILFLAAMAGALLVVYLMGALGMGGQIPPDNIAWKTNLAEGRAAAAEKQRPIFVDFTQKNCPPCDAMKREAYPDEQVGALLNERFVPVRLDLSSGDDQAWKTAQAFGIYGTPTMVVLDAQGQEIGRMAQYLSASQLAAWLTQFAPAPPVVTSQPSTDGDPS